MQAEGHRFHLCTVILLFAYSTQKIIQNLRKFSVGFFDFCTYTPRMSEHIEHSKHSLKAGYAAIVVVCVLILAKTGAYFASGSASILSSLVDSILDSLISIMALLSIYYARRPADEDHRWGHGKMEAVSALFQSAVIIGGGAFLVFESVGRLFSPVTVQHHMLGIAVMVFSMILSAGLVFVQRLSLRKRQSLAVEADSAHYGSDIVVNIGVLLVLLAGANGAPLWIDPLFALGVAIFMAYLARDIAGKAMNMLLDRELPEDERRKIIEVIEKHQGVMGWHDLRTHRNGEVYVISFDMEADGGLSLHAAHDIAKDLEEGILGIYPKAEILIHIDPHGHTEDARHRVKGVHH